MQSIYDNADEVVVVDRDPYLDDKTRGACEYTLEFISAFSRKPGAGSTGFFKGTFRVLDGKPLSPGANPHKPGTQVVNFIKPDEYEYHIKDIKGMIGALTNTKASTVSKSNIDEVVGEDNPCAGVRVKATIAPKKPGSTFLKVTYAPLEQNA